MDLWSRVQGLWEEFFRPLAIPIATPPWRRGESFQDPSFLGRSILYIGEVQCLAPTQCFSRPMDGVICAKVSCSRLWRPKGDDQRVDRSSQVHSRSEVRNQRGMFANLQTDALTKPSVSDEGAAREEVELEIVA